MIHIRPLPLLCAFLLPLMSGPAHADGVSAIKACEGDTERPEDTARLTILPNGESRGNDTAADLIKMARQKAKEGKDEEAIKWAAFCNFFDPKEQEAIKRDSIAVLPYLKQ
jgi:hypothetical protein